MTQTHPHTRAFGLLLALLTLAACARDAEAAQRARLEAWFALGETVEFAARSDCAAGLYRVVDGRVRAAMPVVTSAPAMTRALAERGRAVLGARGQVPDAAIVAMANFDRPVGMAMRRAGLEARACMGDATASAFRHALMTPGAYLGWDGANDALMLMDPKSGLLIVAMGAG